jgi:hypothetical protein
MKWLLSTALILSLLAVAYVSYPRAQAGFDLKAALAALDQTGGVLDLRQLTGEIVVSEPLRIGVSQQGSCGPIGRACPRSITVLLGTVMIRLVGSGQLRLGSSSAIVGSGSGGFATAIQLETGRDAIVIDAAEGGVWARIADLDIHTMPAGDSTTGKALIRIRNSPYNRIENVSLFFNGNAQYGVLLEATAAQSTHYSTWYNRIAQLSVQYQTFRTPPIPYSSVGVGLVGAAPAGSQYVGDVSYNYLQLQNIEETGIGLLFSKAHHNTVMGGHLLANTVNVMFADATHNSLYGIKGNQPFSGQQVTMSGTSYFNAFYSPAFSLPHLLGPSVNSTTRSSATRRCTSVCPALTSSRSRQSCSRSVRARRPTICAATAGEHWRTRGRPVRASRRSGVRDRRLAACTRS